MKKRTSSTSISSSSQKVFKPSKNKVKTMDTVQNIAMTATFRVTTNSPLNGKSIRQIHETFKEIKVVSINNPAYSYSTKKIVGKDILEDYVLQDPVIVTIEGDYDVVNSLSSFA